MSKNKFNRRDFLHFMSMASAGGFLSSSLPLYKAYANNGTAPLRLLILPKYYGWLVRQSTTDKTFDLDPNDPYGFKFKEYLSPFESIKEHITVIENLRGVHWGNAHDHSYANMLTNACVQNELRSQQLQYNEPMGPSIDWLLGKRLNKQVLRADFGIGRGAPVCFDDKYIRQPMLTSVESIFDEVIKPILDFQNGQSNADALLSSINQELFNLLGKSTDRIENLLRGTGNEERKMRSFKDSLSFSDPNSNKVTSTLMNIPNISRPNGSSLDVLETLQIALSLTKTAFMADTKRIGVISFSGNTPFDKILWKDKDGVNQVGMAKVNEDWMALGNPSKPTAFHHLVSHYTPGANSALCFAASIKPYAQVVADFVRDLASTTDVDGKPMIDNTCIVLTGDIATGTHDTKRKPLFVIGGKGAGGFRPGRFIESPIVNARETIINEQTRSGNIVRSSVSGTMVGARTHSDVFVAIARAMGVSMNTFGFEVRNTSPFSL